MKVIAFLSAAIFFSQNPCEQWYFSKLQKTDSESYKAENFSLKTQAENSGFYNQSEESAALENEEFDFYEDAFEEEGAALLEELENPEFGPQSEGVLEEGKISSEVERIYRNPFNRIKYFEYGEETLSVGNFNGSKEIISVNESVVVMKKYNEEFCLAKKIEWDNSTESADKKLLRETDYTYGSETGNLILQSEKNYQASVFTQTYYGKHKLPVRIVVWNMNEGGNKISRVLDYEYDEKNRVVAEKTLSYFYSQTSGGKTSRTQKEEKKLYTYKNQSDEPEEENETELEPDMEYFVDGTLRVTVFYEDENVRTETLYFDGGFKIINRYENEIKVKEIILNNDVETNRY